MRIGRLEESLRHDIASLVIFEQLGQLHCKCKATCQFLKRLNGEVFEFRLNKRSWILLGCMRFAVCI